MLLTPIEWLLLTTLVVVAFTTWQTKHAWVRVIWLCAFIIGLVINIVQMQASHLESKNLKDARSHLRNFSEYGEVAALNFKGAKSIGRDYSVPGPLSGWNDKFVRDMGAEKQVRYDDAAIAKYEFIRKAFPKYPFSYFFLAESYKLRGDARWREYALEAVNILKITTTLPNHAPDHDEALKILQITLSDPDTK